MGRGDAQQWAVLCPNTGLTLPQEELSPFKEALQGLPLEDRVQWADEVTDEILSFFPETTDVWILGSKPYREHLAPMLRTQGIRVWEPLARLDIGKQLQWLGGTMEIDLRALEAELQAMTEEEAMAEMLKIQKVRMTQSSASTGERAKSQRELLKALKEAMKEDPALKEQLLGS